MNVARDALGIIIVFSIAFSVFATQIMINELAPDARSALAFADHLSMSVDHFFQVFIRLVLFAIASALGVLVSSAVAGGWSLVKGVGRVSARLRRRLQPQSNNTTMLWRTNAPPNSPALREGNYRDMENILRNVEFKITRTQVTFNFLSAVVLFLVAAFMSQTIIRSLIVARVDDIWTDPAYFSGRLLVDGLYLFVSTYFGLTLIWRRLDFKVDGTDFSTEDNALEKKFGDEVAAEIWRDGDDYRNARHLRFAQRLAVGFLFLYLPFVAYFHGLSLANSYYYRMLNYDRTAARLEPGQPGQVGNTMIDGKAVIRVVEQGVIFFDQDAENLVFANDEHSISAVYLLRSKGVIEIAKRPSCPLGVASPLMRFVLVNGHVLDDLPIIGDSFPLRRCPNLGDIRAKNSAPKQKVGPT